MSKQRRKKGLAGKGKTREDVIRDRRRKEFSDEVGMGLLNCQRYRKLWREAKLYTDLPNIRTKIEVGWQAFERAIDAKDFRITFLLNGLSEAEAQSRRKEVGRTAVFDRSIQYHETRLQSAKTDFRRSLEEALAERNAQAEEIAYLRKDVDQHVRKIQLFLQHQREDSGTNVRSNAISKIDAFIEDAQNERRDEAARFEERLLYFCHELQRALVQYRQGAEKRRSIYDAIDDKDKKQRRIIAGQYIEISSLFGQVETMRWKLASLERTSAEQLNQIGEESMFFRDLYRAKLNNFMRCKNLDKNRARFVSSKYDAVWRYLKELVARAERILGLVALCRKYETQGEKVLLPEEGIRRDPSLLTMQRVFKSIQVVYDIHGTATLWHRLAVARSTSSQLHKRKKDLASRVSTLRQAVTRRWAGPAGNAPLK